MHPSRVVWEAKHFVNAHLPTQIIAWVWFPGPGDRAWHGGDGSFRSEPRTRQPVPRRQGVGKTAISTLASTGQRCGADTLGASSCEVGHGSLVGDEYGAIFEARLKKIIDRFAAPRMCYYGRDTPLLGGPPRRGGRGQLLSPPAEGRDSVSARRSQRLPQVVRGLRAGARFSL